MGKPSWRGLEAVMEWVRGRRPMTKLEGAANV